jgi:hypothetical protein
MMAQTQMPGNCQREICDGAGVQVSTPDDTDAPANSNECALSMCMGGAAMTTNRPHGTSCTVNGHTCDGSGTCMDSFYVLRVDGTSSGAAAVSLEERRLDGVIIGTVALPTENDGGNLAYSNSGSAASEGSLSLSGDGRYLIAAGYNATVPTANVASTAGINRLIARVDATGAVDTTTTIDSATAFTTDNFRGATSQDGTAFWASGNGASGTGGIWYVPLGGSGLVQILNSPANTRWPNVFGGQLYASASTGSTFNNVFTVGSGLPTTGPQTATVLHGMPATGPSPFSFVLFDRDATAGYELMYVSDDGNAANQGIQKWTLSAGTWTRVATFNLSPAVDFKGLAGVVTGSNVTLIATTDQGTAANRIVTFVDTGSGTPTGNVISTSQSGQIYRGVALAPHR